MSGHGGEVAASGGETNDKVSARYNREGHQRILLHRTDWLGAGLAWSGEQYFKATRHCPQDEEVFAVVLF